VTQKNNVLWQKKIRWQIHATIQKECMPHHVDVAYCYRCKQVLSSIHRNNQSSRDGRPFRHSLAVPVIVQKAHDVKLCVVDYGAKSTTQAHLHAPKSWVLLCPFA